jgi:hypothetical protein
MAFTGGDVGADDAQAVSASGRPRAAYEAARTTAWLGLSNLVTKEKRLSPNGKFIDWFRRGP